MPELTRALINRLRMKIFDRRSAERFAVHLEVELMLSVSLREGASAGDEREHRESLKITGYTRDISATGLGVIVPSIRVGDKYLTGEDRTLQIRLSLPTGQIKLSAKPVRYTQLDDDRDDTGFLIGLSIEEIIESDRELYLNYLQTLKTSEA